jgi:hypothetical protein
MALIQLKVGLPAGKNGYFDPNTQTYITMRKPLATISADDADTNALVARLKNITAAVLAQFPSLVLYEGNIPQPCVDDWENNFVDKIFKGPQRVDPIYLDGSPRIKEKIDEGTRVLDRPTIINGESADVVTAGLKEAEIVSEEELKAESVSEPEQIELLSEEEVSAEESPVEEIKDEKKTTTRKKATDKTDK